MPASVALAGWPPGRRVERSHCVKRERGIRRSMTGWRSPKTARSPLAQAVHEFLDWRAPDKGRGPTTVRACHQDLSRFVAYCTAVDVETLAQVDPGCAGEVLPGAAGRGMADVVAPSAPTRHRRLVALRSLLRFCACEESSPGDLGVTIDLHRLPRRLPNRWHAGGLERMTADPAAGGDEMDAAGRPDGRWWPSSWPPVLSAGCPISEALALDRLDWNTHSVIVRGKGDSNAPSSSPTAPAPGRRLLARCDDGPALLVFVRSTRGECHAGSTVLFHNSVAGDQ